MNSTTHPDRRRFLQVAGTGAALSLGACAAVCRGAAPTGKPLQIGHAEIDITPPKGAELAGFHRSPGNERKITGTRHPSAVRALVLRTGEQVVALVSLDIIAVSRSFASQVQKQVAEQAAIPAENVRVCATHTHSMPTFAFLRQWGAIPEEFQKQVMEKTVQAVCQAKDDLAPGELYLGKSQVVDGNFNRTTPQWKTEAEFGPQSTDADRWLDTTLHVLRFERSGKPDVLWYHFSCHPVCFMDGESGPDWVGYVGDYVRGKYGVTPGFLQGHAGDVNPGKGKPWIGEPAPTTVAIILGFDAALSAAKRVPVSEIRCVAGEFQAPLDVELFKQQMDIYRRDPASCNGGVWVDPPFAKDWFASAETFDMNRQTLATPMSALRLGDLGLLFHSAELFSGYGLTIRRDSPFANTLVVGYTDDFIGYVTDAKSFINGEYEAVVVPKILGYPPFVRGSGNQLAAQAKAMLTRLA